MTPYLDLNPKGLRVARSQNALSYSGLVKSIRRIAGHAAPHFSPTGRIVLKILDRLGAKHCKPIAQCEWLEHPKFKLALCRNPYPMHPADQWLLCHPDGTACYSAPSPEIVRLHFYFITGALSVAKTTPTYVKREKTKPVHRSVVDLERKQF